MDELAIGDVVYDTRIQYLGLVVGTIDCGGAVLLSFPWSDKNKPFPAVITEVRRRTRHG